MKRLAVLLPLALAAAACGPLASIPASPSSIADATTKDETLALGVENSYRAARLAMELAVDSGALRGANAAKAARLDAVAYKAVKATRIAYDTGNAASYVAAAEKAVKATGDLLAVKKGS